MSRPEESSKRIITIDGPAGSGKSTLARKLAIHLGLIHLNSGALFRAVAFLAKEQNVSFDDELALERLTKSLEFKFKLGDFGQTVVIINGRDINQELNFAEVGQWASQIAVLSAVREQLLLVQRGLAKTNSGIVAEGRDAGTVVFPDANFKFFLEASVDVRAKRRFLQLKESLAAEKVPTLKEIENQILERDHKDSTREIAPAVKAEDAILVDTTGLSLEEVLGKLIAKVG